MDQILVIKKTISGNTRHFFYKRISKKQVIPLGFRSHDFPEMTPDGISVFVEPTEEISTEAEPIPSDGLIYDPDYCYIDYYPYDPS